MAGSTDALRDYSTATSSVRKHYEDMHRLQTLDYVLAKEEEYKTLHHARLTIRQAIGLLEEFVDPSDPDVQSPNALHLYETVERARTLHPNEPWFHFVALVHDLGKILYSFGEPTWAIVGDTFPLGCAFADECIFYESFAQNADAGGFSALGLYKEGCGLDRLHMAWGHDEYMYRVLCANDAQNERLPLLAKRIVRFHSFYPLFDRGAYSCFCNPSEDEELLWWLREFNKCDLYSKQDHLQVTDEMRQYTDALIERFAPGQLQF